MSDTRHLAVIYAFSLWSAEDRELMITFEMLLIHGFPFLGAFALLRPKRWYWHIARFLVFWGLFAAYMAIAHLEAGWTGVGFLLGLGFATYGGMFFTRERAAAAMGTRWLIAIMAMFFSMILAGVGAMVFGGSKDFANPAYGALFFLMLAAAEFVDLPGVMQRDSKGRKPVPG